LIGDKKETENMFKESETNVKHFKHIGGAESTTIEWKQSLSEINEIIETAAAFANAEGGRIFIGVSPDGRAAGVQIGKGTVEKLVNQTAQHTDPKLHPKVSVKKIDGKEVIVVEVRESHDHLVLAFGRTSVLALQPGAWEKRNTSS